MRPRTVRALAVAAVLAVAACDGAALTPAPAESDAVRLWKAWVWNPLDCPVEPALHAAELSLEAPEVLPLDDAFVFTAATLSLGDLDRGLPSVHVVRTRQPDRPGGLLLQGLAQSLRHNRKDALAAFDACILQVVGRPEAEPFAEEVRFLAHLYRGQEHYLLQDYTAAVGDLLRAQTLLAEHGGGVHRELIQFLADANVHIQQFEPAEQLLRDAIAVDPRYPAHRFQLGMVLANQARTDEASVAYRECLKLAPEDPTPRLKLAEIARRDGDLPAMKEQLDAIAQRMREGELGGELSAARGAYQMALAREKAAAGDETGAREAYRQAREHLLRAVETNPLCTRSYTLLVQVAALLGAPQEEIERYKKALEDLEEAKSAFPAAGDPFRTFC